MTQVEAEKREKALSNVKYEVSLALLKGKSFFGHLVAEFDSTDDHIFLDFLGTGVDGIKVNGKPQKAKIAKNRVHLAV